MMKPSSPKQRSSFWQEWSLAAHLAYREAGLVPRSFIVFVLCLLISTFALSAISSILSSIERGVDVSARSLLDGDLSLSQTYNPLTPEQITYLEAQAKSYSVAATMRATMKLADGTDQLIAIKAVNAAYPQFAHFEPQEKLPILQEDNQAILVDPSILRTHNLTIGDSLQIGYHTMRIVGAVERESDLSIQTLRTSPRVVMSLEALQATQLLQPGSLIRWSYRIVLPQDQSAKNFQEEWRRTFADERWRFRDQDDAAPRVTNALNNVDAFLMIVQLATFIIVGIGIANTFGAYIQERRQAIAVWKCMGAENFLIRRIYIIECCIMALWGLIPGLFLGNIMPLMLSDLLSQWLNITIVATPSILLVLEQILTITLVTGIFILMPLYQAQNISALELFRGRGQPHLKLKQWGVVALLTLIVGLYLIIFSSNQVLASYFMLGVVLAMMLFALLAQIIARTIALWMPRLLRISLARPGAATTSVCMSIGMGLSMLLLLAIFQSSLIINTLGVQKEEQPSLFLMGIQPNQSLQIETLAKQQETSRHFKTVPVLRARIVSINGVARNLLPDHIRKHWVVSGDRIVTWSQDIPENTKIMDGAWWSADTQDENLVSLSHEEANELDLSVNDTLTMSVLGREIRVRIAAIHEVHWDGFAMNFVLIFSPQALQGAPHSFMGTINIDDENQLDAFRKDLSTQLPNVTIVPVNDIIQEVRSLLTILARILVVVGSVTLTAGLLVLVGQAMARQRLVTYQTTIYRLCGANSRQIILLNAGFYLIVGIVATCMALLVGMLGSYLLINHYFGAEWGFSWKSVGFTLVVAPLAAILTGLISAAFALGRKPFHILRNE